MLEAERTRVEREIGELAHGIEDPVRIGELRELSERRAQAETDLARLRALLEALAPAGRNPPGLPRTQAGARSKRWMRAAASRARVESRNDRRDST